MAMDSCPACFGPTTQTAVNLPVNVQPQDVSTDQNNPAPINAEPQHQNVFTNQSNTTLETTANDAQPQPVSQSSEVETIQQPLVICLDGNFQQRHHAAACRNYLPLVTPSKFIDPQSTNNMLDLIKAQEQIHCVRNTVSRLGSKSLGNHQELTVFFVWFLPPHRMFISSSPTDVLTHIKLLMTSGTSQPGKLVMIRV